MTTGNECILFPISIVFGVNYNVGKLQGFHPFSVYKPFTTLIVVNMFLFKFVFYNSINDYDRFIQKLTKIIVRNEYLFQTYIGYHSALTASILFNNKEHIYEE